MGFSKFTMDDYDILPDGRILNKRWNRYIKPQPNNKGYGRVQLCGKFYFVHRLVAEKFIPNPNNLPQVNHIDGDKTNNCIENLEWVTNQENRDHAIKNGLHLQGEKCSWSKLTLENVKYIRNHREISRKELSELFGVAISTIKDIQNGHSWKNS